MIKAASLPPEPHPPAKQAPKSADRPSLLGITEDENYQLYEARCMLQLLEDLVQDADGDVTVSKQSLAVMMGVIREKLELKDDCLPADARKEALEKQAIMAALGIPEEDVSH